MNPIKDNQDVACFSLIKHSWKGRYKRIFSIGSLGITTYNPQTLEVTNRWVYSDFISILPTNKAPSQHSNEFVITMKKDRKTDSMKFSTEHRAQLLTDALKFRNQFAEKPKEALRYNASKYHWSYTPLPVVLEVTPYSLDQLDPTSGLVLASYYYKDIEGLVEVKDYHGGFIVVCGGFGRMHLFSSLEYKDIRQHMLESAIQYIGVGIKVLKEQVTMQEFTNQRLGIYNNDVSITSSSEFSVYKVSTRHFGNDQKRTLCLSETCLIERDPQTYNICTLRPLKDIFALIRSRENPQLFMIEYNSGQTRTYKASDRDSLLASLLDGVRASGNRDVHVKMSITARGKRFGPLSIPLDEEVESIHLKYLQQPPGKRSFAEIVERFNVNIPYSGLIHSTQESIFAENKDKLIIAALQVLITRDGDTKSIPFPELEGQFQALRRLFASRVGYSSFLELPGFRENIGIKVVRALKREDVGVTHAALDMICALMHPMHEDYNLHKEQLNKTSLLSSNSFLESLLDMWLVHVNRGTGALVVSSMLDFLTFALCVPYSETTEGKHFDNLLEMVAKRGRLIFRLFQHPSLAIVKGAGLVMRALIEEGELEMSTRMQDLALSEGALPRHLLTAVFTSVKDGRQLANRQLSRHLVGLWISGHCTALGLLKRILPQGLLVFLESDEKVPVSVLEQEHLATRDNLKLAQDHANKTRKGPQRIAIERQLKIVEKHLEHALQHWGARIGFERREEKMRERPIVLRKRRERIKSEANWSLFYYKFNLDHALPNLIWNHKTREELRSALENEIRSFDNDCDHAGNNALIAWNHQEFEVHYVSLTEEVRIGEYYLRLLLEMDRADAEESPIRRSYEFFNELYHRFLLTNRSEMKCMCLQAMAIVYGKHYEDIGPFPDTKYIVGMLDKCTDKTERDRLVLFIQKLMLNKRNVRDFMDAFGVRSLVDLLMLAHLHTTRARVPTQSNVIEAGPGMSNDGELEWYYGNGDGKKTGPLSFKEMKKLWKKGTLNPKMKCWSMGMDGWKPLYQIAQLKWCMLAKGSPVLNESDLATLILNILIDICSFYPSRDADDAIIRPLPRIKKLLSDNSCLPHIVQLLLTFDTVLVEKVATLLCEVMKDNPAQTRLYSTGVFYFILMYNGSNVLPIAHFLKMTHTNQAIKSNEGQGSDIMQRSVLGQLLPEAMVNYLENHGAEKFAQIFLGEFDTPEAIWNSEMRRLLIQKLSAHTSEYAPRLGSNVRVPYQYCAIPAIRYPQLEEELFCHIFYLRHLCDITRFSDWPIPDPVALLREVLEAWRHEVERKPPAMSIEEACASLGLNPDKVHDEASARKAYYRLAQQFHPDKNPEGRERFEEVNRAYEFLCSRTSWTSHGPDPNNIVLILKTQSILFDRYQYDLEPYKYAGYPQLVKTIKIEADDDALFSKQAPLLAAASELAYLTVRCSPLNAEEMRREKGLDILLEAYSRCVGVLNKSSQQGDVEVQVCIHVTRCFDVAARFPACRERMLEMPQLIKDLCRILYFKHLPKLCCVATECVSSLAIESILQVRLLQSGVLWNLMFYMLVYDYTLEEGGVERDKDANTQELYNELAKQAVRACARLGGYLPDDLATPINELARAVLNCLLTPYLANQLALDQPKVLLKILTSNSETPYLLWDNGTRAELRKFLRDRRRDKPEDGYSMAELDMSSFQYSRHKGEITIGDVYIRIYNEQPSYLLKNPKGFTIDLLEYITKKKYKSKEKDLCLALQSLYHVINNHPSVEMQCIGHFKLLFSLLLQENVAEPALNVVHIVTRCLECVQDISSIDVLPYLLLALYSLQEQQMIILDTLYALVTVTKMVKEMLSRGGILYLIDLFCNSTRGEIRERIAELIARMCSDKLAGPPVRLAFQRFLPAVFLDTMRESPLSCVNLFEGQYDNPELVWNNEFRQTVATSIQEQAQRFRELQKQNFLAIWTPPDKAAFAEYSPPGELIVDGVYLRIFIANPGWALRRPKQFLTELLDHTLTLMSRDSNSAIGDDNLQLATSALVCLLKSQPSLADQVPSLGHIPQLCRQLSSGEGSRSAIMILHQLATSETCIQALGHTDCIGPLKRAMQRSRDTLVVACEALHRLFASNQEQLVKQALDSGLVPYLLGLLEGRLDDIEHSAQAKAQLVKALKAMSRPTTPFGDQIAALLEKSPIWSEYRDQKHDLFIAATPTAAYLMAPAPTTAGYLTQGATRVLPDRPPPMERDESHSPNLLS